jgi:hypothetical protein
LILDLQYFPGCSTRYQKWAELRATLQTQMYQSARAMTVQMQSPTLRQPTMLQPTRQHQVCCPLEQQDCWEYTFLQLLILLLLSLGRKLTTLLLPFQISSPSRLTCFSIWGILGSTQDDLDIGDIFMSLDAEEDMNRIVIIDSI